MSNKKRAKDEVLGDLHIAVTEDLLRRVQSGEASPAELSVAIKFLANNKIEVDTTPGSPMERLANLLPSFTAEDDEELTAH